MTRVPGYVKLMFEDKVITLSEKLLMLNIVGGSKDLI